MSLRCLICDFNVNHYRKSASTPWFGYTVHVNYNCVVVIRDEGVHINQYEVVSITKFPSSRYKSLQIIVIDAKKKRHLANWGPW